MESCKPKPILVVIGRKLSKQDEGPHVNLNIFKRLVESLTYLTTRRRDIIQGVSLIPRFMESPKDSHWKPDKRILRYITRAIVCRILNVRIEENDLIGYTDSEFVGILDDRKSTSSYVFHLVLGVLSWASKKKLIVTLS